MTFSREYIGNYWYWGEITDVETSLEEAGSVLASPSVQAWVLNLTNFFLYSLHMAGFKYQKPVMPFFTDIQSYPKSGHIH